MLFSVVLPLSPASSSIHSLSFGGWFLRNRICIAKVPCGIESTRVLPGGWATKIGEGANTRRSSKAALVAHSKSAGFTKQGSLMIGSGTKD